MKNIYTTILILCFAGFFSLNANSQDLKWVRAIQSGYSEWIYDMKTDQSGNVWLCGLYNGPADFDPGPNEFILSPDNEYFISVAEYNASGVFIKAFKLPVKYPNSVSFNLEKDEVVLTGVQDMNENNYMILVFDLEGTSKWGLEATGLSGKHVAFDKDSYIVSGEFSHSGTLHMDDGDHTITGNLNNYYSDFFLCKIDGNRGLVFLNVILSGSDGIGFGDPIDCGPVVVDNESNIYFSGHAMDHPDFDPDTSIVATLPSSMIFIASYTPDGHFRWVNGALLTIYGYVTAMDISDTQVLIYLSETSSMKNESYDYGTVSMLHSSLTGDSSGSYTFNNTNYMGDDIVRDIDFLDDGTYLISGSSNYKVDLDPGAGEFYMDSTKGRYGSYMARYTADHNLIWADYIMRNPGYSSLFFDLESYDQGFILAGFYAGASDFDFSARVVTTPEGTQGNFIAKYGNSLSVPEENAGSAVSVYPNPFENKTVIEFKSPNAGFVQLYNLEGRMLKTFYPDNAKQVEIDLENRTPGIYLYKAVDAEGNIVSGRLIKTK